MVSNYVHRLIELFSCRYILEYVLEKTLWNIIDSFPEIIFRLRKDLNFIREMKKLTSEMHIEIGTITLRRLDIKQYVLPPLWNYATGLVRDFLGDPKESYTSASAELNTFKVRLENMLCETDKKDRVHKNDRLGIGPRNRDILETGFNEPLQISFS